MVKMKTEYNYISYSHKQSRFVKRIIFFIIAFTSSSFFYISAQTKAKQNRINPKDL
jgi:hypothetical protein